MKRFWLFAALLITYFAVGICPLSTVAAQFPTSQFKPIGNDSFAGGEITHSERIALPDGLAHYRFSVKVGSGQFDVIRLHRIVRERMPYWPVQTVNGIFLLPGSPNHFEAIFMAPTISNAAPPDHSMVLFLAKNNVDVWGMDYAWSLIPPETTDFTFMKDWGLAKDSHDAEIGLSVARLIRAITHQGVGPLELLGFSYGGIIGYNIAGEETQKLRALRNIKGFVPLDVGIKFTDEAILNFECAAAEVDQANLDAGTYSDDSGLFLKQLSDLALSSPNDDSPIVPGLTNYQAVLFFGTNTEGLTGQWWHFVGGEMDANGIPNNLRFTEAKLWEDVLGNIPPHLPMRTNFDVDTLFCGKRPTRFDDHLAQISIPIFFVGAAGGFGETGYYTVTLTSSKDTKKVIVKEMTDEQRAEDFGHADTVLARDAEALVWNPILDWLLAHR
jgi:hypothetical protein